MSTIQDLTAHEILDSRGNPTIEVELTTNDGKFIASVPSGASTGEKEACELRDGDKSRFLGKGVLKAIDNVKNVIAPAVKGKPVDVKSLDALMLSLDGTENKSKLGANAILGVSMAVCRAQAASQKLPLWKFLNQLAGNPKPIMPVPMFNCINGGVHAGNFLAPQEFFLIPSGASNFAEALRLGSETYHHLKDLLKKQYGVDSTAVGDEGGFAPNVSSPEEALQLLVDAIKVAGHEGKIVIGADPASSEFYIPELKIYDLDFKRPGGHSSKHTSATTGEAVAHRELSTDQMMQFWVEMSKKYPLVLLEDPFDENDFEGFQKITQLIGDKVEIVGDDLLCTNPKIVKKAVELKAGNAMLLKINQIGSITEAIEAYNICRQNNWGVFVSHRSGETTDDFIADLTVGLGTGHLKTGAPCRGERLAKYNQLLRIERSDSTLGFAGVNFRKSGHF